MALSEIRNSFKPHIPIRWKVEFNVPDLNVVAGHQFPAKEVTYNKLTINTIEVPLAPGVNISVNSIKSPVTEVQITFYENSNREIYKYFKSISDNLDIGRGGFDRLNQLQLTIIEYDVTLESIISKDIFIVQFSGEWVSLLVQDPVPYELPAVFKVIGTNKVD